MRYVAARMPDQPGFTVLDTVTQTPVVGEQHASAALTTLAAERMNRAYERARESV